MIEKEVLEDLRRVGALVTDGHFVYTSGRHGGVYINKDALYPHTEKTSELCREMARPFEGEEVDFVVAPALGGIVLSQWIAYHLSQLKGREILAVYAEKEGGSFAIRRGYAELIARRKILVAEDIVTTGGSVRKIVEMVRALGGEVIGVTCLCNRGGVAAGEIGRVPRLVALATLALESWEATGCPLCAKGVPIHTQLGKGGRP